MSTNKITGCEHEGIVNEYLNVWMDGIKDPKLDKSTENNSDIIYTILKPKFKYFKPPFEINIFGIKISFMWAYKIDKSYLFTNCKPSKMSYEN